MCNNLGATVLCKSLITLKYDDMHVLPLHVRNTMKSEILSMEARIRLTFGHEAKKVERILKIYNIYESNCFDDGLSIKTSRFNHSCQPNAGMGQPFNFQKKDPTI